MKFNFFGVWLDPPNPAYLPAEADFFNAEFAIMWLIDQLYPYGIEMPN